MTAAPVMMDEPESLLSSIRAAEEFEIGIHELRTQLVQFAHTGEAKYLDPVPRLREETARWLAAAERLATTPPEQRLMRRASSRQGTGS